MTYPEWFKKGNRKCECNDVSLACYKTERKSRIRHSNWMTDYAILMAGLSKYKTITRWRADCDQCGKLYLADSGKQKLTAALIESGIKYKFKKMDTGNKK